MYSLFVGGSTLYVSLDQVYVVHICYILLKNLLVLSSIRIWGLKSVLTADWSIYSFQFWLSYFKLLLVDILSELIYDTGDLTFYQYVITLNL